MGLPLLPISLPRPLTALHQIEITSRCNLRCKYCPSPTLGRPKVDMDVPTFVRALEWARHFVKTGTQRELNLAGIGESTLHPNFVEYVSLARAAVGPVTTLIFATNGLIHDEAMIRALVPYHPVVWVSLHRPEKAGLALELYQKHGLLGGVSTDPSTNANDWAGQVKWKNSPGNAIPCPWLRAGHAMAMADGRITTCCLDATGAGVVGHVGLEPGSVAIAPYALCRTCNQEIGVVGYDQYGTTTKEAT